MPYNDHSLESIRGFFQVVWLWDWKMDRVKRRKRRSDLIDIFMEMVIGIFGGKNREKYSDSRVISGYLVAGISQGWGWRYR